MIIANEKVRLFCDEPGCEESLRVSLTLLPTGGWGVHFPSSASAWQCLIEPKNPMSPYKGRCPAHHTSQIVVPESIVVPS